MVKNKKLLLASLIMAACSTAANAKVIKISHYYSESNVQHQALLKFADEVEKNSNGDIDVRIFPNNTLGSETQTINGVRNGTIEIGLVGNLMQQNDPVFGIFEFPFLLNGYDHAWKALHSKAGDTVAKRYADYGIKHLGYSISGFRNLTSNKKVESPEDYKGLRVRVPNNSMFVTLAKNLGWNAQALSLSEVYTALEQGVVDGQENPYSLIDAQGFNEVQKYVVETNHMFTNMNLMYSQKKWDRLTDEEKKIIQTAAENYSKNSWDMTVNAVKDIKAKFKTKGVTIIVPSDELNDYNRNAVKGMRDDYIKKNPWAEQMFKDISAL